MKIDVYTNIVAVHHGFFFFKLNVLKTGKEKKNRVIQILEKFLEERQILLRKLCSTENVPILALAGIKKIKDF